MNIISENTWVVSSLRSGNRDTKATLPFSDSSIRTQGLNVDWEKRGLVKGKRGDCQDIYIDR